jgi:membrane protein
MQFKELTPVLKRAVSDWSKDRAPALAAALAYYTIFSIAPLLIIAVGVAALMFGDEAVRGELDSQLRGLIGPAGAEVIQELMAGAAKPATSFMATLIGFLALMLGATGVFVQLQDALNVIWKAAPPPINGLTNFLRIRFLSFAMVLGIGFLLLVSLLINTVLSALGTYAQRLFPGWEVLWQFVNFAVSFGVITVLFAMIYKFLPDTHVGWKDVWLGAAITSMLFAIGKLLIGLYLGKSSVASAYGAAGSLVILLLWVYYSAQVLFLGAEFTHAFAETHGTRAAMIRRPRS